MPKFKKKGVVIEALHYTGEWPPVVAWLESFSETGMAFQPGEHPLMTRNDDGSLHIHTLEGVMQADVGDFIIRGVAGEFYPCKPDIFERTYTQLDDEFVLGAFGCEIRVGDLVVYPGRQSSSLFMTLGRATKVGVHKPEYGREHPVVHVQRLKLQQYGLRDTEKTSRRVQAHNCVRVEGTDWDQIVAPPNEVPQS